MRKETLFARIIEAVKATGAEARQTATGAGLYHDGTQHGEIIDFVFISVSRYTAGHYNSDAARIAKEARKAAGRFRGVTIKEVQHQSYYIYQVYTTPDAERAEKLTAKAAIFLEAYHQEQHRQVITGEQRDTQKAIKAGKDALKAAGYTVEATGPAAA